MSTFKTVDQLQATIASQAAEIDGLREHVKNMLAILNTAYALPDNYKQGLEELRQIGSARAALQPKEGGG